MLGSETVSGSLAGKMTTKHYIGIFAITLSWGAMVLGSAPFTPAVLLCGVTLPASLVIGVLGAWRLSLIGVWFGFSALIASPMSGVEPFRLDRFMVFVSLVGGILGIILAVHYRRASGR